MSFTLTAALLIPFDFGFAQPQATQALQIQAFGRATADLLLSHLQRGQRDLEKLKTELKNLSPFPRLTPPSCSPPHFDFACFFQSDLPALHSRFRLLLSLSWSINPSHPFQNRFENAGNPKMHLPVGSPLPDSFEPLSEDEKHEAQEALDLIWEKILLDYVALLEKKSEGRDSFETLYVQKLLLQFEEVQLKATLREKIEASFFIHDPQWVLYRQSRWNKAKFNLKNELWNLVDQIRFLRYLNKRALTAEHVQAALDLSLRDNLALTKQITLAKESLVNYEALKPARPLTLQGARAEVASQNLVWLMQFSSFTQEVLKKHPEWQMEIEGFYRELNRHEKTNSMLKAGVMFSPVLLMVPIVSVALGTIGTVTLLTLISGVTLQFTVESFEKYQDVLKLYLSKLATSSSLRSAHQEALLSPLAFALTLGLPSAKMTSGYR